MITPSPRRLSTAHEVAAALHDLDGDPVRIPAGSWPAGLEGLKSAGLYSWWVDASGAADLSSGLGPVVAAGRIYVGQTGATKWPSGKSSKATLEARIGRAHLAGNVRGSTLRRTLAAALWRSLGLQSAQPSKLLTKSEAHLSAWIASHLEIAVHVFDHRDVLGDLEMGVINHLDPVLNNDAGRAATPVRTALAQRRVAITRGTAGIGFS